MSIVQYLHFLLIAATCKSLLNFIFNIFSLSSKKDNFSWGYVNSENWTSRCLLSAFMLKLYNIPLLVKYWKISQSQNCFSNYSRWFFYQMFWPNKDLRYVWLIWGNFKWVKWKNIFFPIKKHTVFDEIWFFQFLKPLHYIFNTT